MAGREKALIRQLPTGVPGLDEVLGGGLPEYSFNVIAGMPGSGKTTLAHQMMFANATRERPALYFTILGEPPLKMLRYQQQFGFFDRDRVGEAIHFVNLAQEVLEQDLNAVLARIVEEVQALNPGIVVVDSFRTVVRSVQDGPIAGSDLQSFIQRLSLHLATWEATTFLVGEYEDEEIRSNPVFTVADGILWLTQSIELNAVIRKLQVRKMRGRAEIPGLHGYRINPEGVQVFPRVPQNIHTPEVPADQARRLSLGVPGLDALMGGGIPEGDVVLVGGPVGSGKSVLADHFVVTGAQNGEPGVLVMFDERPAQVVARGRRFGFDMDALVDEKLLRLVHLRPTDLSPGEMLFEIVRAVEEIGARRVVLDSLAGLEISLAPTFREEIRETLYRLVEALVSRSITVMATIEVVERYDQFAVSPHNPVSFAVDDIIMQRFIQVDGVIQPVMSILKMRGSEHSREFFQYEISREGLVLGPQLRGFSGILKGTLVPSETRLQRSSDVDAEPSS